MSSSRVDTHVESMGPSNFLFVVPELVRLIES